MAKEAGICYVSIALATDYDCWRNSEERVSVPEVLRKFKENVGKVTKILEAVVVKIASENWDDTILQLHVSMFKF